MATPLLPHKRALDPVRAHVKSLPSARDPAVRAARDQLFELAWTLPVAKLDGADLIYSDAPTGSGKTIGLATLAARLAIRHGLPRVIIVLPFLVTCRQSTRALRATLEAAGVAVAEDTSGARADEAPREGRDSWKQGVTVISAVRFMDILAGRSEARAREYEALADAVLILDDCDQWLDASLAAFVLAKLKGLRDRGARVMLASATLPHYWSMPEMQKLLGFKPAVTELSLPAETAERLARRVRIQRVPRALNFQGVAQMALDHRSLGSGLIVVNTVATSLRLAAVLQQELGNRYTVVPVTSRLCPHDKRLAENQVRQLLEGGAGNILLVATSCVEAGWDVSFAWAARELAWISSILQAAGRVNRHGERSQSAPVYAFELADPLARSNPEQGPQLECMAALWAQHRRLHAGLVTNATRALLDHDPKLLTKAKGLALALRTGDQKHLQAHTRLIQRSRQRCIATVRHLPEAVRKKLKAGPDTIVLAPEALEGLEAYGLDVRRSVFEKSPWKFDVKVINGETYYLLREEFYDPAKGGAQLED